jgi:hypothetical protein
VRTVKALGSFLVLALRPVRHAGRIWSWWPLVLASATLVAGVLGLALPTKFPLDRAWTVALVLTVMLLLTLHAAVRMYLDMHPEFPSHHLDLGNPMYVERADEWGDLLLLNVAFTSRHDRNISLRFDLFWKKDYGHGRSVGPSSFSPYHGSLGTLDVIEQPAAVDPFTSLSGHLALSPASAFGVEGEHGDVVLEPGVTLTLRLTDLVSGARIDVPVPVRQIMTPREATTAGG